MIEIKFTPAQNDWLEVTWTEVTQLPDVVTPATPAPYDADGNEVQPAAPETTTPGGTERKELKHTSYHPTQLDLLQADAEAMGTSLDEYADMLANWVADYVLPAPPVLTLEDFDRALTAHLDTTAQQRRYDNRITCMVRAGFPGPFQAEGQAFATWCDNCNAAAYQLLALVQQGKSPAPPSVEAFLSSLPVMVWPTVA